MKLKTQMLLAGLLTLGVPLVAWQSVRELDASLLSGRAEAQRLAMARLKLALVDDAAIARTLPVPTTIADGEIYAQSASAPLHVDGYADDWREWQGAALSLETPDGALSLWAAQRAGRLFLMIDIDDDRAVYHRPPRLDADAGEGELPRGLARLANGDALQLFVASETGAEHAVLSAVAPGALTVRRASRGSAGPRSRTLGQPLRSWQAAWTEQAGGHRIELSLPWPEPVPHLGIAWFDVDRAGAAATVAGTVSPFAMRALHRRTLDDASLNRLPRVYRADPLVQRLLEQRVPAGTRVRLFDAAGRLLGDVDRLNATGEAACFDSLADALLFRVFAFLVAGDLPLSERAYAGVAENAGAVSGIDPADPAMQRLRSTQRYVTPQLDRVLGTLEPTGSASPSGWLWYETNEEHSAAYTGSRLARLFSLVVLASVLAPAVLLGWAAWLSARIRRLSRSAAQAVGADGRVANRDSVRSDAADELGDLSRDLAALLERSGDYHRHLEAMGSHLSHELRTPLAVIRSSLEHLRAETSPRGTDPTSADALLSRAEGGAKQLDAMIRGLIASTRLEQSLERAERTPVSLDLLLRDCRERYRQLYPDWHIDSIPSSTASSDKHSLRIDAAPDLLVQALDKLVDNAVDHAADPTLQLLCEARTETVFIGVANRLRAEHRADTAGLARWFEPMHSARAASGSGRLDAQLGPNLGLGLHLVQLIARWHGGRAVATQGHGWTRVGLWLPRE